MRGLAVFISDIRNCEWRRGRGLGRAALAVAVGRCPAAPGLRPSIPSLVLPSSPRAPPRAARSAPVSRNGDALGGAARRGGGGGIKDLPVGSCGLGGGSGCSPAPLAPLSSPSPGPELGGGRPGGGGGGVGGAAVGDAPERGRGAGGSAAGRGQASLGSFQSPQPLSGHRVTDGKQASVGAWEQGPPCLCLGLASVVLEIPL